MRQSHEACSELKIKVTSLTHKLDNLESKERQLIQVCKSFLLSIEVTAFKVESIWNQGILFFYLVLEKTDAPLAQLTQNESSTDAQIELNRVISILSIVGK